MAVVSRPRLRNLGSHLTATAASQPEDLSLSSLVTLRDGVKMPMFGLGTYLSEMGGECLEACTAALGMGYVMLDTANMYNNEAEVGASLAGRDRSDVFIVTKHSGEHGRASTLAAIDESLNKLGLEYVDLYLIHNPKGGKCLETWQAMLDIKASGKARAVGVSNFGLKHLKGIKEAGLELPEVNQIELHCWLQQKELTAYCEHEKITVMGYCPLARTKRFKDSALLSIAELLGKTEAQIAIRWSIQSGFITIPNSSTASRIAQNAGGGICMQPLSALNVLMCVACRCVWLELGRRSHASYLSAGGRGFQSVWLCQRPGHPLGGHQVVYGSASWLTGRRHCYYCF